MLMLDGIHQNNVHFFAIYQTCVSCHCRLFVVSVLGSDREEILLTRIWVATIGFTLFFGPILAKAFRVYYIFRSIKLKKKVS